MRKILTVTVAALALTLSVAPVDAKGFSARSSFSSRSFSAPKPSYRPTYKPTYKSTVTPKGTTSHSWFFWGTPNKKVEDCDWEDWWTGDEDCEEIKKD